jgi:2-polyprenyl-3-methyl-5-hydroxy-6-metoxy-1,4-benzoquinol methylase
MQTRSQEKELIDLCPDYYTPQEYTQCMRMLFRINCLLGFFGSTRRILNRVPAEASILDVGCGDGLFILHLSRYYPHMVFTGMDVSGPSIAQAQQTAREWDASRVRFEQQAQLRLDLAKDSVDVVLTTLVCHHIADDDLVEFLRNIYQAARNRVIINDLHRHWCAYWLYYGMSRCLFRNRLITHDGLISIRRGFKRAEWRGLLARAGIQHYEIHWQFPFRWSVVLWKN